MPAEIIKTSSETQYKIWLAAIVLGALLASTGWARNLNHNGDFDGDEIMDPTVYCEATGEWPFRYPGQVDLDLPPWALGDGIPTDFIDAPASTAPVEGFV